MSIKNSISYSKVACSSINSKSDELFLNNDNNFQQRQSNASQILMTPCDHESLKLNLGDDNSPVDDTKHYSYAYVNKNGLTQVLKIGTDQQQHKDSITVGGGGGVGGGGSSERLNNKNIMTLSASASSSNENLSTKSTCASSTTSLVKTNRDGYIEINTNTMLNEEHIDIKYEDVKYLSIVIMLFCWCFPCTGLPALIYSRLMHKYYKLREMAIAKKYLKKAEKFLMLTFIFGLSLLAILFAILQGHFFNNKNIPSIVNTTEPHMHAPIVFHK